VRAFSDYYNRCTRENTKRAKLLAELKKLEKDQTKHSEALNSTIQVRTFVMLAIMDRSLALAASLLVVGVAASFCSSSLLLSFHETTITTIEHNYLMKLVEMIEKRNEKKALLTFDESPCYLCFRTSSSLDSCPIWHHSTRIRSYSQFPINPCYSVDQSNSHAGMEQECRCGTELLDQS
jgi:hypothetical protein